MRQPFWKFAPDGATPEQHRNYRNVQIDGIGIGIASAAAAFLPVFLARTGATSLQISLLSVMPALTGMVFALPIGWFLQDRTNIVKWFSTSRLLVISAYALTGLMPFFLRGADAVPAILVIWACVTVPQTTVSVAFSVVMNEVAGPQGRYFLMGRRWSLLGLTTAIMVAVAGKVLDSIAYPVNYQVVFMALSLGGLLSFTFSRSIVLSARGAPRPQRRWRIRMRVASYARRVRREPAFLSFVSTRAVFALGVSLAAPVFPIFFVRVANLSDTWIGALNTVLTSSMLGGYFVWTRLSRTRGPRFVLLATVLGLSLYPLGVSFLRHPLPIVAMAGAAGFFQAGLDLVFFDELMRRVPLRYGATFVAVSQLFLYASAIVAPPLGSLLVDHLGAAPALLASSVIRLAGFALFALVGTGSARSTGRRAGDQGLRGGSLRGERVFRAGQVRSADGPEGPSSSDPRCT
jgi:hypothetical protein